MNVKLIGAVLGSLVLASPMVARAEKAKKPQPEVMPGETQKKASAGKAGTGRAGVTTGDDDDINDLEVQRKQRQPPTGIKPGKASAPDSMEKLQNRERREDKKVMRDDLKRK